jgi:hypothetical protein
MHQEKSGNPAQDVTKWRDEEIGVERATSKKKENVKKK